MDRKYNEVMYVNFSSNLLIILYRPSRAARNIVAATAVYFIHSSISSIHISCVHRSLAKAIVVF